MDKYRIKALLKHQDNPLAIKEIIKKCDILIKGAIKHQNIDAENYYTTLRKQLASLHKAP